MAATARAVDMTDVKEGGGQFNKRRVPAGDYLAKVTKVDDATVKKGDNEGKAQWLFTIKLEKVQGTAYPYYCTLVPNQLWKVRNLCLAAGIQVPRAKVKIDPNRLVNRLIGVTMEDDEYEGKKQSVIQAVFPASELEDYEDAEAEDAEDDDEDDDEDEAPPPPAKKAAGSKARRAAAPEPEEEDEEDEEDEEEDDEEEEEPPPPPRRRAKSAAAKKTTRSRRAAVEDDELDELDLDEI